MSEEGIDSNHASERLVDPSRYSSPRRSCEMRVALRMTKGYCSWLRLVIYVLERKEVQQKMMRLSSLVNTRGPRLQGNRRNLTENFSRKRFVLERKGPCLRRAKGYVPIEMDYDSEKNRKD